MICVLLIGQERGGLNSYQLLGNLAGWQSHNADRIVFERELQVGDRVRLGPPGNPVHAVVGSERGSQDCALAGVIQPGKTLRIWAMGGDGGFNCGFGSTIWNNSEADAAVLLGPDGGEVGRFGG